MSSENKTVDKDFVETAREEKMSELDILRQSVEEKKKQYDELYDQLMRLKAEFDNYRKRAEKDRHAHMMWGKEDVLIKQMGILDVLEQAYKSAQISDNVESIKQGLGMIIQEFVKMLVSEGLSEIDCLGKPFDPQLHEALEQVDSEEDDGKVLEVVRKGYSVNGKIVRPSKVKVAKHTEEK